MLRALCAVIIIIYSLLVIIGERNVLDDARSLVSFVIGGTQSIYKHYKEPESECDSLNVIEL